MIKQIYIKPRQTGKTTQAVNAFKNVLKKEGKGIYFCYNSDMNPIKKQLGDDLDTSRMLLTSYNSNPDKIEAIFQGTNFKIIVMDEFLNIRSKIQRGMYDTLTRQSDKIDYLYMCSTPNMQVPKAMIDYITYGKGNLKYKDMLEYCSSYFWVDEDIFSYWYNSFITDADSNLIVDSFFATSTPTEAYESILGTEAYEIEIKNKIFI